jgi:tetratricopeptide (TPR) repeat protein
MNKRLMIGLILFVVALAMYMVTLAPTILWNDSGELISAAATLGIAHPTGYPLFVLVGKFFSLLPIGTVAYRLNIMSAFFSALSVLMVFFIVSRLTRKIFVAVVSSLALAFSYTFWDQATFAEVYPLHVFLFSAIILLLLEWDEKQKNTQIYSVAFLSGLSLCNHLLSLLLLPPIIYFVLIKEHQKWLDIKLRKSIINFKVVLILALLFLLGLSLYVYLPLRSLQHPPVDWGKPDNLVNFVRHITGREFGYKMLDFSLIPNQVAVQAENLFIKQFQIVLGLVGLFGFIVLLKKNFRIGVFFIIFMCFHLFFALSYKIEDILYYYLPFYLIFSVFIGIGLSDMCDRIIKNKTRKRWVPLFFAVCFGLVLLLILINFSITTKKGQYFPYDYARNIVRDLDENSVIFTRGDVDLFPIMYYTLIENTSKKITMIDTVLLSKPWYVDELRENKKMRITYNKTIPYYYRNEGEADVVVSALIRNIVENNINATSIYFTIYFSDSSEINLPNYYVIPQDHVYRISTENKSAVVNLSMDYRGLNDPKINKDEKTRTLLSNIPIFLGIYYLNRGDISHAEQDFLLSVTIKQDSFVAHANLGYIYYLQHDYQKSLSEFSKAYKIDPKNKFIYNNIIMLRSLLQQA